MIKAIIIVGVLSLAVVSNANTHDSARIDQLEKQIQELKLRISKLDSILSAPNSHKEIASSSDGWKSMTNWRMLSTDMGPSDVKKILGEPHRVDGGIVADWYYQNDGRVTFVNGKVTNWREPRE